MRAPGRVDLPAAFAAAMDHLGPFEDGPALAVAVSGGADSMALALLARDWAVGCGGSVHAFVVDHGLRPDSAAEASVTIDRLTALRIPATRLTLAGLQRGSALAERARIARYAALSAACLASGRLHLLLGHHAGDQAETLAMRVLRRSGSHGLAGMPSLAETADLRLLRPLLAVLPVALRAFLRERGIGWVEDPSNRDRAALRPRLRLGFQDTDIAPLSVAARRAGEVRARDEAATAVALAMTATIRPEGFAVLPAQRIDPRALAALVQAIAGAPYPPDGARIAFLAAAMAPATLAGVRVAPMRGGWVLVREAAAMAAPIAAAAGVRWDGRMRLAGALPDLRGVTIGPLADDAPAFRRHSALPSVVLRTLPVLRRDTVVLAVPHLGYVSDRQFARATLVFDPPRPAAGAVFHSV